MTNTRDIKRRIKSVQSTQQITKAMKMVSASKLRKAQAAVLTVRPYSHKVEEVVNDISGSVDHEFLKERETIKKVCYLVLGSDRGLCGGFNGNLHRFLDQQLAKEEHDFALYVIGKRVLEYCTRKEYPIDFQFTSIGDNPNFDQGKELASMLRNDFVSKKYDEIYLVFSEFKSAMMQIPVVKKLLPVTLPEQEEKKENTLATDFIIEPSKEELLEALLPQYVDIAVYCALQEAKASEHGARMTTMSSATENAADMIQKLTLALNRARQAAITTEITEIISGAAALT